MSQANKPNPYQSSMTTNVGISLKGRSFVLGEDEIFTIHVIPSIWLGLRTIAVDARGVQVAEHRGPCQFIVGEHEIHRVRVDVDQVGRTNISVNGILLARNIFSQLRAAVFSGVFVFLLLTFLVVAFAFWFLHS